MSANASHLLLAILPVLSCAHRPAPIVHTHSTGADGVFANAYLVETESGVVAIDATLTVSNGRALRAQLEALKKPLLAVLLTHGHPDHYNGLTELTAGESVPIVATRSTDEVIRRDDAAKEALWKPIFGAEWPEVRTFPDRIVEDGETVVFDGVPFTVHQLGPGESHADSYWVLDDDAARTAFVGDAVFNGMHAYLTDGHSASWLSNLSRLETELAGVTSIRPGHGAAGGHEMFRAEREYLELYRATVGRLAAGATTLSEAAKAELTAVMKQHLATDQLEFLIPLGADSVASELASER